MNLYLKIDEDLQKYLDRIYCDDKSYDAEDVEYWFFKENQDDEMWISIYVHKDANNPDLWDVSTSYVSVEDHHFDDDSKNIEIEKIHAKAKELYDPNKLYSDDEVNQIIREIMRLI